MPNLKPLTKQRWVVTVDGATSINFDTCTGLKVERSKTDYNDGVTGITRVVIGFMKNGALMLGKVADEETDTPLRDWITTQQTNGNQPFNVSIQAVSVNKAGEPVASYKPITATQCVIGDVTYPEIERTSSDLAKWEVEVIVNGDIA